MNQSMNIDEFNKGRLNIQILRLHEIYKQINKQKRRGVLKWK